MLTPVYYDGDYLGMIGSGLIGVVILACMPIHHGKRVVSVARDGTVKVWGTASSQELLSLSHREPMLVDVRPPRRGNPLFVVILLNSRSGSSPYTSLIAAREREFPP